LRLLAAVIVTTCACSVQAKAARHLDRGDRYFDDKKYREAIIEYRNVLEAEPDNAQALKRAGIAHYELRELGQAYRYLSRASDLDPADLDVRWRLAVIHAFSRQPDEARRHAEFVLQKDPNNVDALGVVAETADSAEELDAAIAAVTEARGRIPKPERASRLLGLLYLKKREGAKAEQAFRDAVKAAPESVEAHMSLALLHFANGQVALAEKEFKAAADAAPAGSSARLGLADFYVGQKRVGEARQVLAAITEHDPDFVPAWLRLAELALVEKKYDEAEKALRTVLDKNPRHAIALLLQSQVRLAQGKTDEAMQLVQTALKQEPNFAPAHLQLGLAHLRAGNEQQARVALRQAVTLAPGSAPAVLQLSELNLKVDAPEPVIDDLNRLLSARPGLPRAYELLGAAYLKKGETARAHEVYQKLEKTLPATDPRVPYYAGLTLRRQGKPQEARKAFQESLARAPGAADPLRELVNMSLEERRPEVALEIARKQAQAAPKSAAVQHVLGMVHQRRGELAEAEAAYGKAAELDPGHVPARLELGRIYAGTGRHDQALAQMARVLGADAKNVEAWQVSGMARLGKGDFAKAQEEFKKALDINPRFAPAANNLAWLYSERGGDAEEALRLAQVAKEGAPDDPYVSDTLGWVLYKRGVYQRALTLLKESAARLPDSASVQFHLGMAYYKAGDKTAARQTLSKALQLNASFDGADEARRVLSEL
jgi:tetratricopeptide (TPR) repeat protein